MIRVLETADGLEAAWWNLWRRDPRAGVFQSPAWLVPWREAFADGATRLLTIDDADGRLLALVPFFRHEERLLLWGAGTSDWLDGLFDPSLATASLVEGLARLGEPLDLFQLPPDSPLARIAAPAGFRDTAGEAAPCHVTSLPCAPGRHLRDNLRLYGRRWREAGFACRAAGPAGFAALVDLHARRWQARGDSGVLADARVRAWHEAALPRLAAAGFLRLWHLTDGQRVAAALYVLHARDRASYYIGGFDPDDARLSPGTILIAHALSQAETEGARVFDFLRGDESYKARWGATPVPSVARALVPAGRGA